MRYKKHNQYLIKILIIFLLFSVNLYSQSDNNIQELLKELEVVKSDSAKIQIYTKLSRAYTNIDYKLKRKYAEKYMLLGRKLKIDTLEIEGLIDIGISEALQQKNDSAYYYFLLAHDKSKVIEYHNGLGRTSVNLGFIQEQTNNTQVSIEYYKQAIQYFKKTKNKRGIAQCFTNIGSIYYDNGLLEMAHYYFKEANKIYRSIDNKSGIANMIYSFANVNRMLNKFDESKKLYLESITLRDSLNDLNGKALSYWGLGKLYQDHKEYEKALEYCFKSYDINKQIDNKQNVNHVANTLSDIYTEMGDFKNAIKYSDINLKIAADLKNDKSRLKAYRNRAHLSTKIGDYQQASLYYSKLIVLNDSIDQKSITQQIFLTEMNRVKDEAKVLEKDNIIIASKVSEYLKTIIAISLFLIVVTVLSILLIKKNSEKVLVNKVLVEQKEALFQANEKISEINKKLNDHVQIIENQNNELEQVNNVKNKFFSIISHDMRGPLANLHMLIELYRDNQLSKSELDTLFASIDNSINETRTFLDNLLEWSKNQLEGLKVDKGNFDLFKIVDRNLNLYQIQINSKEISIVNQVEPNTIAFADANMIDVVIRNLLSNSIKFCKKGDVITLNATSKNNFIEYTISDTGVGMSEENAQKIFQLVNSKSIGTSGEIGHQIGLVLCKDMIDINGGTISVESKLGVGTTFSINIPKSQ